MKLSIKTKTCIWRLKFSLTMHPLCNLGQCCHYIETGPLIYGANQWDGFYIMATLDWNKLILTTTFSIYHFFHSWRNSLSPNVQPNQTYFLRLVVLVYPLAVLVCPLVVLICPLVVSICPIIVLVVLSVGLFITDHIFVW